MSDNKNIKTGKPIFFQKTPVFYRTPKLMLFLSSPTFKTWVELELEYMNANSSVFFVI